MLGLHVLDGVGLVGRPELALGAGPLDQVAVGRVGRQEELFGHSWNDLAGRLAFLPCWHRRLDFLA